MIKITPKKNLFPLKVFGGILLCLGMFTLMLNDALYSGRSLAIFLVSYLFLGLSVRTIITSNNIIKKRGWIFPYASAEYNQLKRIELRAMYIYQHGFGAHSHYALYVGIIDGNLNHFINLSSGIKSTSHCEDYINFVTQLKELTKLPVLLTDEFNLQFENKFGCKFKIEGTNNE